MQRLVGATLRMGPRLPIALQVRSMGRVSKLSSAHEVRRTLLTAAGTLVGASAVVSAYTDYPLPDTCLQLSAKAVTLGLNTFLIPMGMELGKFDFRNICRSVMHTRQPDLLFEFSYHQPPKKSLCFRHEKAVERLTHAIETSSLNDIFHEKGLDVGRVSRRFATDLTHEGVRVDAVSTPDTQASSFRGGEEFSLFYTDDQVMTVHKYLSRYCSTSTLRKTGEFMDEAYLNGDKGAKFTFLDLKAR